MKQPYPLVTLIITLIMISIIMSSCSKVFQVYDVASKDLKKESRMFVYEDDTVKVLYNFWDKNGRMMFAVQNKLSKPITIDWKKSKFSRNGMMLPYWKDESRVKTAGQASTWGFGNGLNIWGFTTYSSNSVISRDVENTYLVPDAWTERYDYEIVEDPDEKISNSIEELAKRGVPKSDRARVKKQLEKEAKATYENDPLTFIPDQSPHKFRNYITITVEDEASKVKSVDNSFYVSAVESSSVRKGKTFRSTEKQKLPDRFFLLRNHLRPFQYPKNNIFVSGTWGFTQDLVNAIPWQAAGCELGYSRLIKNRVELGLGYGYSRQSFRAYYGGDAPKFDTDGHGVFLLLKYYVNYNDKTRFCLALNPSVGFQGEAIRNEYGIMYSAKNIIKAGVKLELGGNFGGLGFNFNPYFFGGIQSTSATIIQTSSPYALAPDFKYDTMIAIAGIGLRLRFQFPRLN